MKPKIIVKQPCKHEKGWLIPVSILWIFRKKIYVCKNCGMNFDEKRIKKWLKV